MSRIVVRCQIRKAMTRYVHRWTVAISQVSLWWQVKEVSRHYSKTATCPVEAAFFVKCQELVTECKTVTPVVIQHQQTFNLCKERREFVVDNLINLHLMYWCYKQYTYYFELVISKWCFVLHNKIVKRLTEEQGRCHLLHLYLPVDSVVDMKKGFVRITFASWSQDYNFVHESMDS